MTTQYNTPEHWIEQGLTSHQTH